MSARAEEYALRGSRVAREARPVVALFGAAIFLSAGLVFLVQPMTAKLLLPTFGGSPQVWTASIVFFQAALLAGYAWAHVSVRRFGRRQPIVHVGLLLLAALALPIAVRGTGAAESLPPGAAVVAILLVSVGAPYVAVSATSPLLQQWFSGTGHRAARDPYFLYAAGNVGSLVGLLGYPLLIEPRLPLAQQGLLWSVGYVAFALLCAACAAVLLRRTADGELVAPVDAAPAESIKIRRRLGWLVRAFVPSSLMLAVTTYSATDVAAVPLLWVIPLSLYLVTFVLAFSRRQPINARGWARILPFTTALVILTIVGVLPLPIWGRLAIHYLGFFVAAMVAHTQLAEDRPGPAHLTGFYLILALGGVLGGLFNAIVAPAIFDSVLEYPLVLVLALLLRPSGSAVDPRSRRLDLLVPFAFFLAVLAVLVTVRRLAPAADVAGPVVAIGVLATLVLIARPTRHALATGGLLAIAFVGGASPLLADRTFFGVSRVVDDGQGRHVLLSGQTIHGIERWEPGGEDIPLSYYHPSGPAGEVFEALPGSTDGAPVNARVAIVGLGAGSLAAYGKAGQQYTFVEIDPAVIGIATNPDLFRFVTESEARIDIERADGRLWLAHTDDRSFDLIVLDAFSSDSIPAHLVTREALAMYATKLRPGGRLLVHVSNAYLDVGSVVAGGALAAGLRGFHRVDSDIGTAPPGDKEASAWMILAAGDAELGDIGRDPRWTPIDTLERRVVWTDDFSDILGVIK